MEDTSTDFLKGLYDTPHHRAVSISISSIFLAMMVGTNYLNVITIHFDSQINRQATLLTKFTCTIQHLFVLWTPVQLIDAVRFITGSPIDSRLCIAYTFCRIILVNIFYTLLAINAVFHYRFITFKSNFPLVKEDLVHR